MHIITLITDFGTKGYRIASLKGSLLSVRPDIQLIDVSHEISPFNIDEAAFILRSSFANFPDGTIHIVNVYNYYGNQNRTIFFEYNNQYFIGPDNGVFSLVFENLEVPIYTVPTEANQSHYAAIYAVILKGLTAGIPLEEIGKPIEDMHRKLILQPVTAEHEIRGSVIFIDRYGNVTVNIKKEVFERIRGGRGFSLFFNRHDHIHKLSEHYMEVDIGSPLCGFNSQGYLEIAVNLQRADELLGIKYGDVIQIKFQD